MTTDDLFTYGLFALAAVAIFFMFRNSRKRRAQEEEMRSKMVPGTEIMTQGGIYGTIISIDEEKNEAIIETTPGTQLRVHRQIIGRIVEPTVPADEDDAAEESAAELNEDHAITAEPEYGERIETAQKPVRTSRKKAAE